MKALKLLVISMGLLICVGIGLVGYGLTRSKPQPGMQQPASQTREPFKATVPAGAGWKLEQVYTTADRIVLRFSTPEGIRLILLDSHTGDPAGDIFLPPDSK